MHKSSLHVGNLIWNVEQVLPNSKGPSEAFVDFERLILEGVVYVHPFKSFFYARIS